MATNTLLQRLDPSASTTGSSVAASHRRQTEDFLAGGAIAAGDWVAFDNSQVGPNQLLYVTEAAGVATKGNPAAFGVALAAAASGDRVTVVVSGYCESAQVAAATVAGSALVGPIGTAGRAEIEVPGTTTGQLCGIALTDDSAVTNYAQVIVLKQF